MSNAISYSAFKKEFLKIQDTAPSYRLGQYFISNFIVKEDNTADYIFLWEEVDNFVAEQFIFKLIDQLQ